MEFHVPINIEALPSPITYQHKILLVGSCFTDHIGNKLQELKFNTLQNPNGIIFDPYSVSENLVSYIRNKQYGPDDLVYLNELWQSWHHHSSFSRTNREECLEGISRSQQQAHDFLKKADWLIITFGTSFSYQLIKEELPVANCHRAPSTSFRKHLMTIEEIKSCLDNCFHQLFHFNPELKILLTISPVRHIRDGVTENNRSKARLIETVHHFASKFNRIFYFPAYELVIDVLRDYRFYDADLAHPNYQATSFVIEKFREYCVHPEAQKLMDEIQKLVIAHKHRPFQPATNAHKQFLQSNLQKALALQEKYPYLNFSGEISYFGGSAPPSVPAATAG
jgi:hypothetical protein